MAGTEQFAPFAVPAQYPTANSKVGSLISPFDVEFAVLRTLSAWVSPYLTQIEMDRGIPVGTVKRPPGPESFRGSLDGAVFQEDETPTFVVVVEANEPPERYASSGYMQQYDVTVLVVAIQQSEDESRQLASYLGAAVMGAVTQQGDLGGAAVETRMSATPRNELVTSENRTIVVNRSMYAVFIQPILDDQYSGTFLDTPTEPPWGQWPQVTSEDVTVTADPIDQGA